MWWVQDLVRVLKNFKSQRNPGRPRSSYTAQVRASACRPSPQRALSSDPERHSVFSAALQDIPRQDNVTHLGRS